MSETLSVNSNISHYRILEKLGAGGMGEVFLAEDTRLERRAALKILPADFARDSERMRRFVLEAKATSALNHPNIITIYEIGAEEETNFIAAEYIEGETLRERLKANSFSTNDCLEIGVQIASALQAAHAVNIVHRDIKPENIMIRPDGLVKILDFGIAKLSEPSASAGRLNIDTEAATKQQTQTAHGMIVGTAAYMSPEQAQGKAVDARSDIFSFGAVLYEMLARRQPFAGETAMDILGRILHREPTPLNQLLPEIPAEFERIINKALCKDCPERYQTAKDLLVDLKELKEELSFRLKLKRASQSSRETESPTQIIKAPTDENTRATEETARANSIAVLPFANLSNDAENEYFCDGLAEELLNALAKIDELKVAARTSAFSFKNKNVEVSEIGNALNVKTVLEGSVRKSGNKLRITVQLINAADGYHLWSERYDREMRDIFDVQDEITLAVVDALKLKLLGAEKAAVLKRYTDNTEAYELYLKGLFYYNRHSPEDWLKGLVCFEQAVAIEPKYAPAFAAMGFCYTALYVFGVLAPDEIIPRWKDATESALAADENLAEARLSAASLSFYYEWDWTKAEREFRRAIELNPNNAVAHSYFGMFLASRARFDEAIGEGKRAVGLDPLSLEANLILGWIYKFADRMDETLAQARRTMELEPNFYGSYWQTGYVRLAQGKYPEAIEPLEKAASLGSDRLALSMLGFAYGAAGKRDEAAEILRQLLETRERQYATAASIARVYGGLGLADKTFEWLEKAVKERDGELVFHDRISKIGIGKLWGDPFHTDSRILNLLSRSGLITDEAAPEKITNKASEAQTAMLSLTATGEPETAKTVANADEQRQPGKPKAKRKWWLFGLLGLILLTSGFFAYRYFVPTSKQIESIAVLPFENASGNSDLDYLSDGVSESVIDRLSQLPQLKVIARSSSFRYRGQNFNLQEIADALGVDAIITGRVVPRGDSYQIRVELVDAREDKQLWGENFTRKTSDVQILQTDISREIAENLRLRLSATQTEQLVIQRTTNPQAYEMLLKGRFYLNKGAGNFQKAIEYFEQAVAADPNYALAYTDLAEGYNFGNCRGLDQKQCLIKREALARKALEIEPNLADAHFALAEVKRDAWEWREAEREYLRAIELNPNLPRAYRGYAHYLGLTGRHDEATAYVKRAREFDPLSVIMGNAVGGTLFQARRYDEAVEAFRKVLELNKNSVVAHQGLGNAYAAKAMFREAIAEYQEAIESRGGNSPGIEALLGAVYVKTGERGRAEEILQKLKAQGNGSSSQALAVLYDALGKRDEAFAQLEKVYAERDWSLPYIGVDPNYDNLRSDPRFQDLLRRMNLPQ